ncbi:thiamine phosphate synthase [Sphingobacterium bovisgrunnientis]|jgi:thiamine-phosphate pyrophosphorylase|uniref:thiamine phosphate synthase n=1 Tax=Sphingobacterium bovisgrunnientis TaxID=1874697 RepID=UPI00135748FE|nr:thiamine phosphate synthase [Sphingobacterium bovisgrunnientis]
MIVVISPEQNLPNETLWVNRLFEEGLERFHVRKSSIDDSSVIDYLKQIDSAYYSKLVLHDRPHVAADFGLTHFHYSEKERNGILSKPKHNSFFSTSVHGIDEFNTLGFFWDSAFLSPIFPSVSKIGYGVDSSVSKQLKFRTNYSTKLIGLGGITPQNMHEVLAKGADGVALLGAIWQSQNPLETFKSCKK